MKLEFILKLLNQENLTFEEFFLLNCLLEREKNSSSLELKEKTLEYYTFGAEYPDEIHKIVRKLEANKYLEVYPSFIKHRNFSYVLDLQKLKITEKFKDLLFTDDKEGVFLQMKQIWGSSYLIGAKTISTMNPLQGGDYEDIQDRFWKLCENGNLNKIESVLHNTRLYVKHIDNNMNLVKYIMGYEGYLDTLKEKINELY